MHRGDKKKRFKCDFFGRFRFWQTPETRPYFGKTTSKFGNKSITKFGRTPVSSKLSTFPTETRKPTGVAFSLWWKYSMD